MSFILRFLCSFVILVIPLIPKNKNEYKVSIIPINGKNEIFLIEKGESLYNMKNLSKKFPGFNYDPYLYFYKNTPSVVWVNKYKGLYSLVFYSKDKFSKYIIDLPFEISAPVVDEDISGKLILFLPSPEGIFYSFLEENSLNFHSFFSLPSFFISTKKDRNGILWIAWSGFDGRDWEIYIARWNGSIFEVERITDDDSQDVEPSISLEPWEISWKSFENGKFIIKSFRGYYLSKLGEEEFEMDMNSFIAFGDSITYGMVDGKPEAEGYVPRLERLLQAEYSRNIKVLNRGIPGEDTVAGLSRIERVIKEDPSRYILIMEGTNDVWHYPAWFTGINLEEMVKISLSYNMKPLLANIIPKAFWAEYLNPRIEEINGFITQIAEKYKIPLVDQFNAFLSYPEEKGGWRALYSGHNHPNEEGYQLMAEVWFEAITKLPRFKEKEIDWRNRKGKKNNFNF